MEIAAEQAWQYGQLGDGSSQRANFYIADGFYNCNNWGVSDLGANGWRAKYALGINPFVTHIRAGTPGETLEWVSRLPIKHKLTPVLGNPGEVVSTTFQQNGAVNGRFIGIHYR